MLRCVAYLERESLYFYFYFEDTAIMYVNVGPIKLNTSFYILVMTLCAKIMALV